mgnify:CR=1 FL=1
MKKRNWRIDPNRQQTRGLPLNHEILEFVGDGVHSDRRAMVGHAASKNTSNDHQGDAILAKNSNLPSPFFGHAPHQCHRPGSKGHCFECDRPNLSDRCVRVKKGGNEPTGTQTWGLLYPNRNGKRNSYRENCKKVISIPLTAERELP